MPVRNSSAAFTSAAVNKTPTTEAFGNNSFSKAVRETTLKLNSSSEAGMSAASEVDEMTVKSQPYLGKVKSVIAFVYENKKIWE